LIIQNKNARSNRIASLGASYRMLLPGGLINRYSDKTRSPNQTPRSAQRFLFVSLREKKGTGGVKERKTINEKSPESRFTLGPGQNFQFPISNFQVATVDHDFRLTPQRPFPHPLPGVSSIRHRKGSDLRSLKESFRLRTKMSVSTRSQALEHLTRCFFQVG
jgi:hypothetical protein